MLVALATLLLAGQTGNPQLLIAPQALEPQLKDPRLVLLHVGAAADYNAGHIRGAQLVTLADLSVSSDDKLRLQLPPAETLRSKLQQMGVSNSSKVVIYAGNDSLQSATRIWFTFDSLSIPAQLLNGGLASWKAAGFEVTEDKPNVQTATSLTVKPRADVVAEAAWLAQHYKDSGMALIDARLPEFYSGKNAGNMPRPGRIPGARNVPFVSLLGERREFLPTAELTQKLGTQPIVTYCHIGMQATVIYFAARLTGVDVKLYDGSFEDWSRRTDLPVEVEK